MSQSLLRKLRRNKTKEGIRAGTIASAKRNLSPSELLELQEINRSAAAKAFEANHIKGNTALLPGRRGLFGFFSNKSELIAETEAVARLLADVRSQRVQQLLAACGYPADLLCDINLMTGEITLPKNEA